MKSPSLPHLNIPQGPSLIFPPVPFLCSPARPFSLSKRSVLTFFQCRYPSGPPSAAPSFRYHHVPLSTPSGAKPLISANRISSGVNAANATSKKYSEAE